jgi:hypothetical protein
MKENKISEKQQEPRIFQLWEQIMNSSEEENKEKEERK